jgi:hypothetical protein
LTASPDYRGYAKACLEIAETAGDKRTRAVFIQMAQVWFRLAEEFAEEKTVLPEKPLADAD